jgi:hypothetical protein
VRILLDRLARFSMLLLAGGFVRYFPPEKLKLLNESGVT